MQSCDFNTRGEYEGGPDGCAIDFETSATGFQIVENTIYRRLAQLSHTIIASVYRVRHATVTLLWTPMLLWSMRTGPLLRTTQLVRCPNPFVGSLTEWLYLYCAVVGEVALWCSVTKQPRTTLTSPGTTLSTLVVFSRVGIEPGSHSCPFSSQFCPALRRRQFCAPSSFETYR